MTRRAEFLTALLLLSLLCACARQKPAVSPEPDTAEAASAAETASPVEVTLPNEPLPLTEEGAIAVAEAVSTLPVFPRRTETSVYAASDTALYDLDEGATLPAPGGPAWNQMSEAGVQAFTWYDGEFRDEDFGHLTCDMRIWCVHLHETEDPLNNLYLYLNADTGDLLGTRRVTD